MTATIIDGSAIAVEIRTEVGRGVQKRIAEGKPRPGLATILVGENPASVSYVRGKHKACNEVGIESFGLNLPETARQEELDDLIRKLGADPKVHGILLQLPLPSGLDEARALALIPMDKDVDGMHPVNAGRLAMKGRDPFFVPCTPLGVMVLLARTGVRLAGAEAVVLGRSNLVGMPTALLLVKENATVTICHSQTRDLPAVVRRADVVVAAIGRTEMVRADWIKPGATVIDVGINRVEDASTKTGYRLVGDVAFNEVKEVAGAITPVPRGVGPMTIAMLLSNTLRAAGLADQK
jgi:methylenetetrahydrofolate dehydrogenase (NADP+) / methenyltetrahydrofolate cyclohydrolase